MDIAFLNGTITDPNLLFGRSKDLQVLNSFAKSLTQVELIGARRFGKTCTLKCLQTMLKNSTDAPVIPIYVDMSSDQIIGTSNVYRYLTARILATLFENKSIDSSEIEIDRTIIVLSEEWEKVISQLEAFASITDIISVFKKVARYYSSVLNKCILFLFDEYEFMAQKAFDKPKAFMAIRKLSDEILPSGIPPISFWLAGASPWSKFVDNNSNVGGSGEFNTVTNTHYLVPIDNESFDNMWKYECMKITDETEKQKLISCSSKAFQASGGVPYYAKAIGKDYLATNCFPKYTKLKSQFIEMEKIFSNEEKRILREIANGPKKYEKKSISLENLESYGLIRQAKSGNYIIPIMFYADFCRASLFEQIKVIETNSLLDKQNRIIKLMHDINENWKILKSHYLFNLSNSMSLQQSTLHKQCLNEDIFASFIDKIYVIYWDSNTIDAGPTIPKRHDLPRRFQSSKFRKSMDTMRHYLGNSHFTENFNPQISLQDALLYIYGSQVRPQTTNEWLSLQDCFLSRFIDELELLNNYVKDLINNK